MRAALTGRLLFLGVPGVCERMDGGRMSQGGQKRRPLPEASLSLNAC